MNEPSDLTPLPNQRSADNPFTPHGPAAASMFVGRDREIDLIFGHLLAAQRGHVAVSGPLGSGKSSLLQYVSHPDVAAAYGASSPNVLLQYVDVQSVTPFTFEAFWRRVARIAGRVPGPAATALALRAWLAGYFPATRAVRSEFLAMEQVGPYLTVRERVSWERADGTRTAQQSLAMYEVRAGLIQRAWYYPSALTTPP